MDTYFRNTGNPLQSVVFRAFTIPLTSPLRSVHKRTMGYQTETNQRKRPPLVNRNQLGFTRLNSKLQFRSHLISGNWAYNPSLKLNVTCLTNYFCRAVKGMPRSGELHGQLYSSARSSALCSCQGVGHTTVIGYLWTHHMLSFWHTWVHWRRKTPSDICRC